MIHINLLFTMRKEMQEFSFQQRFKSEHQICVCSDFYLEQFEGEINADMRTRGGDFFRQVFER